MIHRTLSATQYARKIAKYRSAAAADADDDDDDDEDDDDDAGCFLRFDSWGMCRAQGGGQAW